MTTSLRRALAGLVCLAAATGIVHVSWLKEDEDVAKLLIKLPHFDNVELLAATSAAPTTSRSPTTSSPSTRSSTTPSPATNNDGYPLWLPPTPNISVTGTFGDYEWVYPTLGQGNATLYAQSRFVANELVQCEKNQLCCAVGSTTAGQHISVNGRGLDMNFMAEFRPIPARPLFSLVDALKAWRRRTTPNPGGGGAATKKKQRRMKIVFIGDSVTGQVFTAAVCELARNEHVESLTYSYVPKPLVNATHPRFGTSFQETHVKLKGGDEVDYELLYIRQFAWTNNSAAMHVFLHDADVILFGLGLHYTDPYNMHRRIPETLNLLANVLIETHDPSTCNRTLIWLGDSRQSFRYSLTDTHVRGMFEHKDKNPKVRFCGPVTRFPPSHPLSRGVSSDVFDVMTFATKNKFYAPNGRMGASWFRWNAAAKDLLNATTTTTSPHMHFYDFFELTSPFYMNKPSYDANTTIVGWDCTHLLAAPNLYESLWDAMYVLIAGAASASTEEHFPAGTQPFPNIVNRSSSSSMLDYEDIVAKLEGEVLG